MKFILGEKKNMTQFFTEDGTAYPVTVVSVDPIVVTQVKNKEKDGYSALQVGYGEQKRHRLNKAQLGHYKNFGLFKYVKEFRMDEEKIGETKPGDSIDVSVFEEGDIVTVSGTSKGKGFQGVVKRHGMHGGPRTHGQKHSEREVGSIGATGPARVFKGQRMPGRMGGDRVTVKNLKVIHIDKKNNQILIKGAVPGRRGTLIEIVSKK